MHKTVSSRLTAHFNVDGGHLKRYLSRKPIITKSFCEDLILHDQVLIPTQDFLTSCGLILTIGERGFIEIIERGMLKFIRTRGGFGFVSGKGTGEIGIFGDPSHKKPLDAPLEQSVEAGLKLIEGRIKDKKKLLEIIIQNSISIEWSKILKAVKREAVQDLKYTNLWKPEYESNNPDFIAFPAKNKIQVRVIGPGHDPMKNIEDALLALTLYNSDLYLAEKYGCENTSPFFPVGDLLEIKKNRILKTTASLSKFWSLLEINGVPDLSQIDLSQGANFRDILDVVTKKNASDFRDWFHANSGSSEKEIFREYLMVLKQIPWIQRLPSKALRFIITSGFGFIPGLGQAVSFFDSFIVDRLFRGKSPKFFIDDLTSVTGSIKLQQSLSADR